MPPPAPRRLRPRTERLIAVLLVVQLAAGLAAIAVMRDQSQAAGSAQSAPLKSTVRQEGPGRLAEVQVLLATRAAAVLRKDRVAFLATVDPSQIGFRASQERLIDALAAVPLGSWSYELDDSNVQPGNAALDRRLGTWWAPSITLRYSLAGFDREPTARRQGLTFVQREGRWYVAGDADFPNHPTSRDLWDGGEVGVTRGKSCLVLAHPAGLRRARALVGECDKAVRRVTGVWGGAWSQQVVMLLPDSAAEMAKMVPEAGDVSQIAAVATAELLDPEEGYHPVGDRVVVNPAAFSELGAVGRRVVLTHEVMHVASRPASGPHVPTWLVEGLADYVGYLDVDLPLSVSASELRADIRSGRLPSRLPADADFANARSDLPQTYEQSWLAVVLLNETYGQAAVLEVYRTVGADDAPGALERAFQARLRTSVSDFSTVWRADLKRRLA